MIVKPKSFIDLLNLQKYLDKTIEEKRENGFIPRERRDDDILLALDDEFQEWLKELPYEYNFKTWKQKEYNREKELEEITDVLFFYLQYFNFKELTEDEIEDLSFDFDRIDYMDPVYLKNMELEDEIWEFKHYLWNDGISITYNFSTYLNIVALRGFNSDDILSMYWKKWQINMNRINKDWVIGGFKNE